MAKTGRLAKVRSAFERKLLLVSIPNAKTDAGKAQVFHNANDPHNGLLQREFNLLRLAVLYDQTKDQNDLDRLLMAAAIFIMQTGDRGIIGHISHVFSTGQMGEKPLGEIDTLIDRQMGLFALEQLQFRPLSQRS
ncbi:hypothetical protein HYT84_01700 [Candidatus Micrarchaeota archaeon]|nr:hypothetical protein [Candidatus Micrarchaeota archaeon]